MRGNFSCTFLWSGHINFFNGIDYFIERYIFDVLRFEEHLLQVVGRKTEEGEDISSKKNALLNI